MDAVPAASPLLGFDGISGEYWTQLGNLLLDRGSFDQVALAPVAISGAEVFPLGARRRSEQNHHRHRDPAAATALSCDARPLGTG